jgi:hypothetical protein
MTMSIIVSVVYTNETENHGIGEEEAHETRFDTTTELYRFCLKEFGRCKSKVMIDTKDGQVMHVGWFFERREKYEDTNETYLRGVWVTVHEKLPTKTYTEHLADISKPKKSA